MIYKIVSDSSSNLTGYNGGVAFTSVPLHIIIGDRDFADVEGASPLSMQKALDEYKGKTSTSCPNTDEWIQAFGREADVIFCITITSVLSGSYSSANTAKDIYESNNPGKKVYVVDSLSTGPEIALIIEKLNALISEDKDPDEIYAAIKEYMQHTHLFFSLASLNNFARNGRISPILAKGIGLLGVRVIGKAVAGNLKPTGKGRGDSKAIPQLVQLMKESGYKGGRVIIAHSHNHEGAISLKNYIMEQFGVFNGFIHENRLLCSYYAEPQSLLLGFEA